MDILDWVMYLAGGLFGLLTLALGLSRISAFTERDIRPIWWAAFIVVGAVWAVALVADWLFPIDLTIFIVNGGDAPRQIRAGDSILCLPAKSYEELTWRIELPDALVIDSGYGQSEQQFTVGKGTWFVNASPETVTADMYDRASDSIDFGGLFVRPESGLLRVNAHYGRPFRMFSQSSLDRAYDIDGDIKRGSRRGPCGTDDRSR